MHSAPYFAFLGLFTIYLAARVILLRGKYKVGIGDGGVPELARMIRVFGNHTEYSPICLILLIGLEFVQAPVAYIHLAGATLVLGRLLHAMGLSKTEGTSPGRLAGMVFTFISITLSSIGVLIFSLTTP